MNIKLNSNTIGILMVFCAIQTTVYCSHKGLEFAPEFKTKNPYQLLKLVLNEADLVKVAAYKQLKILYKENADDVDLMTYVLYFNLIQSAAELVRHYGVVTNIFKIKQMYDEGTRFAEKCSDEIDHKMSLACYRWQAVLIEAVYFSNPLFSNRYVRKSFEIAFDTADTYRDKNPHLEYLKIKMSCKLKLKNQSKGTSHKKSGLYLENSIINENLDCTSILLQHKDTFHNYESNIGEFYYLLGQFLVIDGEYLKAMEYFRIARQVPVVDKKSRYINEKVQASIEKIYIRDHTPQETIQ